ncbi:MAG: hypothetical protein U1F68_20545 [Gammaproteobacteria bacterium]
MASAIYRTLRADKIIETQSRLQQRIAKRFPGSGLSEVAAELKTVAEEAVVRAHDIRRPNILLRIVVAALLVGALALAAVMARALHVQADLGEVLNLAQFLESSLGSIVFLGAALLFLITLEIRLKRRRALAALHELRALAHVIDMHQVAKDPEGLVRRGPILSEAPDQTTKTLFDLNRYLNYCVELLAIISKIAALYVQDFPDANAVAAVDQIEALCSGLSQKISQKILILEEILDDPGQAGAARRSA